MISNKLIITFQESNKKEEKTTNVIDQGSSVTICDFTIHRK